MITVTTTPPEVADRLAGALHWATDGPDAGDLEALVAEAAAHGASSITLAAHPDPAGLAEVAAATGWVLIRDQLQLRCALPVSPDRRRSGHLTVRAFDPDRDTDRWLEINRRAFAWHPEQGRWDAAALQQHQSAPWFEPAGFLVHDGPDGPMDAFCWTKVHPATAHDPELGEIFVIAVDPDAHGQGLGQAIVLAGLDHLSSRGVDTGMLYVEADNLPAMRLYDGLGFSEHERHRWYRRELQT